MGHCTSRREWKVGSQSTFDGRWRNFYFVVWYLQAAMLIIHQNRDLHVKRALSGDAGAREVTMIIILLESSVSNTSNFGYLASPS